MEINLSKNSSNIISAPTTISAQQTYLWQLHCDNRLIAQTFYIILKLCLLVNYCLIAPLHIYFVYLPWIKWLFCRLIKRLWSNRTLGIHRGYITSSNLHAGVKSFMLTFNESPWGFGLFYNCSQCFVKGESSPRVL